MLSPRLVRPRVLAAWFSGHPVRPRQGPTSYDDVDGRGDDGGLSGRPYA